MTRLKQLAVVVLVSQLGLLLGKAQAAPVTYVQRGILDGTLNGASFTQRAFELRGTSVTEAVSPSSSGCCWLNPIAPLEFTIEGVGAGIFSDPIWAVANKNGTTGFGTILSNLAVLFTWSPELTTYDLRSSIGPISGIGGLNPFASFQTSAGPLSLSSAQAVTFQASVVPVPAAAWLFASAMVGLASLGRNARERTGVTVPRH
jgi:hypothetical protein